MQPPRKHPRPRKTITVPTAERLQNIALFYLSRYAASEASLRRVLHNRMRRAALAHPDFAADHERQAALREAIEKIIETHKRTGAVNDETYAAMKVAGLRRSGRSSRFIQQKLAVKGIKADLTAHSLRTYDRDEADIDEDQDDPEAAELKAARAFAKRKKLGQWRVERGSTEDNEGETPTDPSRDTDEPPNRTFSRKNRLDSSSRQTNPHGATRTQKDFATLARAGFSANVIRKVLNASIDE